MTYTQLQQDVQDYLATKEPTFVSHIPDFVRQAEAKLYRDNPTPDAQNQVFNTVSTQTLQTPTDFIRVRYLEVGGSNLLPKDDSFLVEAYSATNLGPPRFYSLINAAPIPGTPTVIRLAPAPDQSYAYVLSYIQLYSIVDNGNTWLGDHAPDILLNAVLVEAYKYLKGDPDLMGVYKETSDESAQSLAKMPLYSDDFRQ